MHPDLAALLAADDEAKQLVADAGRRVQERVRSAQRERDGEQARLQQQRAEDVERLVRSVEDETRRLEAERAEARNRVRRARADALEQAVARAVDSYLSIVRNPGGSEREP
jgi:hypothetical protein